jgi:hypothetical protein
LSSRFSQKAWISANNLSAACYPWILISIPYYVKPTSKRGSIPINVDYGCARISNHSPFVALKVGCVISQILSYLFIRSSYTFGLDLVTFFTLIVEYAVLSTHELQGLVVATLKLYLLNMESNSLN